MYRYMYWILHQALASHYSQHSHSHTIFILNFLFILFFFCISYSWMKFNFNHFFNVVYTCIYSYFPQYINSFLQSRHDWENLTNIWFLLLSVGTRRQTKHSRTFKTKLQAPQRKNMWFKLCIPKLKFVTHISLMLEFLTVDIID